MRGIRVKGWKKDRKGVKVEKRKEKTGGKMVGERERGGRCRY